MNPVEVSPEQFHKLATKVVRLSTEYPAGLDSRRTFPDISGRESERVFSQILPEKAMGARALSTLEEVIALSRAQNGRFFGYVLGSMEPVAAVGDFLASILNQNITAWRSSPAGVSIERTVVGWLAEAIGCGTFSGTLTSGGSLANLMALAMAREAKLPSNNRAFANLA
jgi:aromatic-L-amino-acid/L-tryptophan decarboxylase